MPIYRNEDLGILVEYIQEQVDNNEVPDHLILVDDEGNPLASGTVKAAKDFLTSTDWYYIRKLERGIEVPETVTRAREQALSVINGW